MSEPKAQEASAPKSQEASAPKTQEVSAPKTQEAKTQEAKALWAITASPNKRFQNQQTVGWNTSIALGGHYGGDGDS